MATHHDVLVHLRHELRTPLNHIIGFGEILLEDNDDGSVAGGLVPVVERLLADAREFLVLLRGPLGTATTEAGIDHNQLAAVLGPALSRLVERSEALRLVSGDSGRDEVERIFVAARRIAALLVPETKADAAAAPAPVAAAVGDDRHTILVVDDNEGNREVLTRRLVRQGYSVVLSEDGRAALVLLRQQPIDLVLLDVMMPEMDGYEVLKQLKSDEALRHVPVLMISALDEMDSVIRCIEMGAEDYLPKPFNHVLLNARISACLEKKRLRDQEVQHLRELAEWNRTLELRVEEQVKQVEQLGRLKRFFSPHLAELIVSGGTDDPLKTHRREITAVFVDLRGFTAFAETSEPEEVMGIMREYHAEMGRLVMAYAGTLEHFAGDGMMIFFNDPVPIENPAEQAVRMALAMCERIASLSAIWRRRGFDLAKGNGIAQGYATIGAIGFEGRWDYGAIGTVTNLAARLCAEAKGGQILTTVRVIADIEDHAHAEEVGELTLKGLQRPVRAFNIMRLKRPPIDPA
jgi:class 3 adenylate cyclase